MPFLDLPPSAQLAAWGGMSPSARSSDPTMLFGNPALLNADMDTIKDFLILHYHATTGKDEPFWVERHEMSLPSSLTEREGHYRRSGRLMLETDELFRDASWHAVLNGQGIEAGDYNPLADALDSATNVAQVRQIAKVIARAARTLPFHDEALAQAMERTG